MPKGAQLMEPGSPVRPVRGLLGRTLASWTTCPSPRLQPPCRCAIPNPGLPPEPSCCDPLPLQVTFEISKQEDWQVPIWIIVGSTLGGLLLLALLVLALWKVRLLQVGTGTVSVSDLKVPGPVLIVTVSYPWKLALPSLLQLHACSHDTWPLPQ